LSSRRSDGGARSGRWMPGPEFLGHIHARIRTQRDSGGAETGCNRARAGRLPESRNETTSHGARNVARRYRAPPRVGLARDHCALQCVSQSGQEAMFTRGTVAQFLVPRMRHRELYAVFHNVRAECGGKSFAETCNALTPLVGRIASLSDGCARSRPHHSAWTKCSFYILGFGGPIRLGLPGRNRGGRYPRHHERHCDDSYA
jgi:hypothetical protein